jgi:photosystem II stability/assembly factor-like uncharacterized protein
MSPDSNTGHEEKLPDPASSAHAEVIQQNSRVPDDTDAAQAKHAERRRRGKWAILAMAIAVVFSISFSAIQPPDPDAFRQSNVFSWFWWCYPREQNGWQRLPTLPRLDLRAVFFVNSRIGWAVGGDGLLILRTGDGGLSWIPQTNMTFSPNGDDALRSEQNIAKQQIQVPPTRRRTREDKLFGVWFADEKQGWVVGEYGTILATIDGGTNWREQISGTMDLLFSVHFTRDGHTGWAVGDNATILATKDGGTNWMQVQETGIGRLDSVFFTAEGRKGWAVGQAGTILATRDGGATWLSQKTKSAKELFSVFFLSNGLQGWAVGAGGTILSTKDGGDTWLMQRTRISSADLFSVRFTKEGQRGWAVGESGAILNTEDGGATWQRQRSETTATLYSLAFTTDSDNGWAVGRNGSVLSTGNGGATWRAQTKNAGGFLKAAQFTPEGRKGWAVGDNGMVLATRDGGISWLAQNSNTRDLLSSVYFTDEGRNGWAVGMGGTIISTTDGGTTWRAQTPRDDLGLASVYFSANARDGWAFGYGAILATSDGGVTWRTQTNNTTLLYSGHFSADGRNGHAVGAAGTILATSDGGTTWRPQISNTKTPLHSVYFTRDGLKGWAVGMGGIVLATSDGGNNWSPQTSGTSEFLNSVTFTSDGRTGWANGEIGRILVTSDGGATWQVHTNNIKTELTSIRFADDGRNGWAVGDNATILSTSDGGATWKELTYRKFPAPIFYVLLIPCLCLLVGAWPRDIVLNRRRSIAERFVSDRPLRAGDTDYLGTARLVDGIYNYLRNPNSKGPLVMAITGPWGSGKSSVVQLLLDRMRAGRFRPVFLNAWHHQNEENALAALLESIRRQGIPSPFTPEGMRYRVKLWKRRLRSRWMKVVMAAVFGMILLGIGIYTHNRWGHLAEDWKSWSTLIHNPSTVIPWLGTILGIVGLVKNASEFLKPFGVEPAQLLASGESGTNLKQLREKTSFRHRFAEEFAEVAQALHPHTLTIIIDDLDRCQPETMMEMLELVNFISTSGECFILLSMEYNAVKSVVAERIEVPLQGRAAENIEKPTAAERLRYAEKWMQKLIQVRLHIPPATKTQYKGLLTGKTDPVLPLLRMKDIIATAQFADRLVAHGSPEVEKLWSAIPVDVQKQLSKWKAAKQKQKSNRNNGSKDKSTETLGEIDSINLKRALVAGINSALWKCPEASRKDESVPDALGDGDRKRFWSNREWLHQSFPRELATFPPRPNLRNTAASMALNLVRRATPWLAGVAILSLIVLCGMFVGDVITGFAVGHPNQQEASAPPKQWELKWKWTKNGLGWLLTSSTNSWDPPVKIPAQVAESSLTKTNKEDRMGPSSQEAQESVRETTMAIVPGERDFNGIWYGITAIALVAGGASWVMKKNSFIAVNDSEEFKMALDKWFPLIHDTHHTPREVKRFINEVRFYAMLTRDADDPDGTPELEEDLVVGYSALKDCRAEILNVDPSGKLPSDLPQSIVPEIRKVLKAKNDPEKSRIFNYFSSVYDRLPKLESKVADDIPPTTSA